MQPELVIGLNAVIIAVTAEQPRILTVQRTEPSFSGAAGPGEAAGDGEELDALPFGPLDPVKDRTLELALRGWVREQTGIELGYVEQLYTFGDRHRDPRERLGGPRVVSIGYITLVRESHLAADNRVQWRPWYEYLPWEDWRAGQPAVIERQLAPALAAWVAEASEREARQRRQERLDIAFGLGGAPWDGERVLERYELLYEAGLVGEAHRDVQARQPPGGVLPHLGRAMCLDHRRIVATALGRLRGKIRYRPVFFELLPPLFTLLQLQHTVEALAGRRLHKQNFRRLMEKGGLVEGTGRLTTDTGGRPAELFRFRREVLRERPAPGVALPAG